MAGWISSKLKVAETLLQQIDQQAASSLGKNDTIRSPLEESLRAAPKRTSSAALPLKYQLPVKPPPPPPLPIGTPSLPDPDTPDRRPPRNSLPPVTDDDWTELLGSSTQISPAARSSEASTPRRTAKKRSIPSSPGAHRGSGSASTAGRPHTKEPASPATDGENPRGGSASLAEQPDDSEKVGSGTELGDGSRLPDDDNVRDDGIVKLGVERGWPRSNASAAAAGSSGSETGSESGSTSDSEDERQRREERRKRRERMMAEKVAEAIKERENVVARLEGEKESLEKILEERERQQAQEASELQTNMIETMEAVDLEKQKHNSTRMEALTCLAKLETTNTALTRALATIQWNLEVEVTRVAELQQEIDAKELVLEEHRRRMSKIHRGFPSSSEVESSKRAELEQEILDAEYSLICDRIAKLKEKAKKLEQSIVITRDEMVRPTEVEVELKRRLSQLTDHLIQKQTQVEALSSEKATLVFRIETVSRLIDENGSSLEATDDIVDFVYGVAGTSEGADIEAGVWQPYNSAPRRALRDRFRSGQRQLGSVVQQLDSIFSAGLVYLRRNPTAQIWALLYLLCLHIWVMYVLMSRSKVSDGSSSGAVFSLESINKTLGS